MILYVSFIKESALHNLIHGEYEERELVCQISDGVYGFIWEAGMDSEDLYDEVEEIKAAHGYTNLTVIHAPLGAAQLEFLQEGLSSFFFINYERFKEETAPEMEIKGINISSYEEGFGKVLSNLYPLPITFRGVKYPSSEAAYQASKRKLDDKSVFDLMVEILSEKLRQHPKLGEEIHRLGGNKFLKKSTHILLKNGREIKKDRWTGANGLFMQALRQAYVNSKTEEPSSPKVKLVTSAGDPAKQERSRLLSLCQVDKSWEPLDCPVNVVLIPMADPAVVDAVVANGGEAPIYPWQPTQNGFLWESDLILVIFDYCLEWQGTEWAVNPTKVRRDLYREILETEFLVFEPRLVNFPD